MKHTLSQNLLLHLRTYLALIRFSLSRSMEFRFDFFFRFIMDCLFYGMTIAFFEVLFLHTNNLGGWQRNEVFLFVSIGLLIDGIYMTAIARNIWEMPALINKGNLDFQLIRPVSSLFFVMTRNFEFGSLLNVLVGFGFMIYSINQFPEMPSILQFFGFAFLILNGIILITCLRLFTVLPVFWTHSDYGFHMLFMSLEQVTEKPEVIFRGLIHVIFTTVLPFLIIANYPARYFFGDLSIYEYLYALGLTSLFAFSVHWLWSRGLKAYSSASS